MAKLAFDILIHAPPDRVAVFFVPQRMPYWFGSEMQAGLEVHGGACDFANGQKVRIAGRMGGREVALTVVVTAFELGRLLEWRFTDPYGVRGLQRWELSARENATLIRMRDEYEMPGAMGRFLDAIFTRHAVARRDLAWLAKLKQLAERS
jgi:hypothetical protein